MFFFERFIPNAYTFTLPLMATDKCYLFGKLLISVSLAGYCRSLNEMTPRQPTQTHNCTADAVTQQMHAAPVQKEDFNSGYGSNSLKCKLGKCKL